MKNYLIPLILLFVVGLSAQDNPDRYQAAIFDSIQVRKDIAYAKYKPSFWKGLFSEGDSISLRFDFYEGKDDNWARRPLVILAHGGAFVKGNKADKHITILAESLAKKGFAVASISYRLREYPSLLKLGYLGVQDARAAIRYFRVNASKFNIHPDHIFFGGVSAGGVMALHTAYLDDGEAMAGRDFESRFGCLDCFGDYRETSSEVQGVISIAGALIDTLCIQADDQVPSIHFHGTNDLVLDDGENLPLAPLMSQYNHLLDRLVEEISEQTDGASLGMEYLITSAKMPLVFGSKAITEQLSKQGIPHEMVSFSEDNHYLMLDKQDQPKPSFYTIEQKTSDFLMQLIQPIPSPKSIKGPRKATANNEARYHAPSGYFTYAWELKGGSIIEQKEAALTVRWDSVGTGSIAYRLGNELGNFGESQLQAIEISPENALQKSLRLVRQHLGWILLAALGLVGLYWAWRKRQRIA